MDDSQTLDDLAALFLSPPGGTAAPAGLAGPAPVRLRPKPSGTPRPAPAPAPAPGRAPSRVAEPRPEPRPERTHGREHDADPTPPTLRLTDEAEEAPGRRPEPRRGGGDPPPAPAVEAVLLGNLPGLADAWLPQYAQLLALRDGPVLLLHPVDDEGADDPFGPEPGEGGGGGPGFELEWIGPGGGEAAAVLKRLDADAGLIERVRVLLSDLPRPPASLVVHAGADGPEAAARFAGVRDWALLSGADPVAIQAAAGVLRRLVAAAPPVASASVGLMVMGSEPGVAEAAAADLDAALGAAVAGGDADRLLDQPVDSLGALPRMNAVARTPLGFTPDGTESEGEDAWPGLLAWIGGLPSGPREPDADAPPARPVGEGDHAEPAVRSTELTLRDAGIRAEATPLPPATPDRPTPAALVGRLAGAIPAGPRLEPITPGCPGQPGVQLALDEQGRLHLVARHVHSEEHPHPREAMLALRDAADWAREHQAWLCAAHPHRRVDASEPIPHLLTDRPDLGLSLAKKLGSALRLYLLHGDVCYALTEAG